MPSRRTALALGAGVALAAVATGTAVHGTGRRDHSAAAIRSLTAAAAELPNPERPAFAVGKPIRLARGNPPARFAPVVRPLVARRKPSPNATAVVQVSRETPEGTTNIVLVLGTRTTDRGQWVRVRLPVLPNGQTGWVPRRALGGYRFVDTRLVVDRERFTATLFSDGRAVFRAPVGVGRPEWPTPSGEFYIRDKLSGFGNPFYGPIAYGTSARSAVLTDWPGGGFVGIHGTNEPELIPGRISHGCIRMRNNDILRLARLMPVGTPLTIE
jgi:L,D-transpeptidase catalytic domain/GW (Gly-Tryp) dipeptide domain